MKNSLVIGFALVVSTIILGCTTKQASVASPDEKIELSFAVDPSGSMSYKVSVDNKPFIRSSALGFTAADSINLSEGFTVKDKRLYSTDQTWTQPWGENKSIRENYNAMDVTLTNSNGVELIMSFKLFNDGVGLRYQYNVEGVDSVFITDEATSFNFAQNGKSWSIPANFDTYELVYAQQPISSIETANTPATFKTDGNVYASIHEAALYDFPEMTLRKADSTGFKATLAQWPDGVKARKANQFATPWRTIQIADKAVGLINSNLILNLNPECALETTNWIKPVKYVGVWWSMHLGVESWVMGDRHGATTENAKKYIDFAAENNIQAVLFEGWNEGWDTWGGTQKFSYTKAYDDFNIVEIARYAKQKNIAIIGHHETGGNIPFYESQLDSALKWYCDLGINMLKTGYAGGFPNGHSHHGQYGVRHYQKVVEAAAAHKMTVNAHEPIKETGIRRTYPNMMTREGVRGMEWNAWSKGNAPEHHEILPFTRMLSGPIDYTPGTFDILYQNISNSTDYKKWNQMGSRECRVNTTLAKQLANWVVLYSPMQMASDMVENYRGHPAFQFFRDLDVDCDWSEALVGEPGEFVAIVRKAKDNYFLGVTTNSEARTITLPLDFLEAGKSYRAVIYADGADAHWQTNPTSYTITEQTLAQSDSLQIAMAAGGGQAIYFQAQ